MVAAGAAAGARSLAEPGDFDAIVAVHTSVAGVDVLAHARGFQSLDRTRGRKVDVHTVKLDARAVVSARMRLPTTEVDAAVVSLLRALETAGQVAMRVTVSLGGSSSVEYARSEFRR